MAWRDDLQRVDYKNVNAPPWQVTPAPVRPAPEAATSNTPAGPFTKVVPGAAKNEVAPFQPDVDMSLRGTIDVQPGDSRRGMGAVTPTSSAVPLLTNRGDGVARVDYPDKATKVAYSKPDTAAIRANYLRARDMGPTPFGGPRAEPSVSVAPGTRGYYEMTGVQPATSAGGQPIYIDRAGRTLTQDDLPRGIMYTPAGATQRQSAFQQEDTAAMAARPKSSIEERALEATRRAVEALTQKPEYRTIRGGGTAGMDYQVPVKSNVAPVNPDQIYSGLVQAMYTSEGRERPTGGERLQADVTREGYRYAGERESAGERGQNYRAELSARTSMYGADQSTARNTQDNESKIKRDRQEETLDKASVDYAKESFKLLDESVKATLGKTEGEQFRTYLRQFIGGEQEQGGQSQLRPAGTLIDRTSGRQVRVFSDANGNLVDEGGNPVNRRQ